MIAKAFSPARQIRAFIHLWRTLVRQRELLFELTRRELVERHAGQIAGNAWTLITPLVWVGVYALIFTVVFSPRGSELIPEGQYPLFLLSGLIPWLFAQEVMSKSVRTILDNGALVKQVAFPVELLPMKSVLAASVPQMVMLAFYFVYAAAKSQLDFSAFLLVLLVPIQMMALFGLAFILSAVGVLLRDAKELVSLFLGFGMFLAPIPYTPGSLPSWMDWVFYANPFSYMVWCFQDALFFGEIRHPVAWVVFPFTALFVAALGYRLLCNLSGWFGERL